MLPMPSGTFKNADRIHRMVILPDYQNLNIGTKLMDWFGDWYINRGKKLFIKSTHVRLANHCMNKNGWIETSSSNVAITSRASKEHLWTCIVNRPAYSFEYVGDDYFTKHHKTLIIDDNDICPSEEFLKDLKNKYYLTVITGNTQVVNDCENLCKKLGIRTEILYVNNGREFVKRSINYNNLIHTNISKDKYNDLLNNINNNNEDNHKKFENDLSFKNLKKFEWDI